MAKFMILYNSTAKASDVMANATPEQMKASMDEWIRWREAASKTITVDFGLPLQGVNRVTPHGITESESLTSGYAMIEGEKDAVLEQLKTHPHLKRPDATIDLLELLPMPGLDVQP